MSAFDIRTFFAGYVLSILLCLIVMASLWWQNRKRSPEISLWLADYVLQFIALLLVTFRGFLPDLFTIVLANIFIIGGTVVLYIGLCRYVGKEIRQLHNYVMLAIFALVHAYFTYVNPNIEARTVNLSLALIYICAQGSWLMLRGVDPSMRTATRATGIVFAAFCFVSLVQIVVNLTMPKSHSIFVSGFFGVVAILIYQILFVALTFALFLLVSRRLSAALEIELFQRTQAKEDLQQSQEKFKKAFQTSPYAIAITRLEDGKFIEVNDTFVTLMGYYREELMAESSIGLKLWVNEKDREDMVSILCQGLPVTGREFLFRKKNGKILMGLYSAQMLQLNNEPCLLSSIDDITDRKLAEEQIRHMATHDLLTDLPSMRLAMDRLSVALNMARRYKKAVAFMFIDLDGFKAVNDNLGHDAGDYVLQQVAQRLLACVRATDTVARVGGDEFLIIATEIDAPENAAQIAKKVIQMVSHPVIFNGQQAVVGASIGIALFSDHGEDMDQLIKLADETMYKVKNAGKNGFRFVNIAMK